MAGNKTKSGKRGGGKREGKSTLKAMKRALIRQTKKSHFSAGTGTARRKQNRTKEGKSGDWKVSDHLSAKARAMQSASSASTEVVIQPGMLQQLTRNSSLSASAQLQGPPSSSIDHTNQSMTKRRRRIYDKTPFFSNAFSALPVMGDESEDDEESAKVVIAPGRLQLSFKGDLSLSKPATNDSGIHESTHTVVLESNSTNSGQDVIDDSDI